MKNVNNRVLLISNSTLYGSGYLDHAAAEICDFLGSVKSVLFMNATSFPHPLTKTS